MNTNKNVNNLSFRKNNQLIDGNDSQLGVTPRSKR